MWTVGLAGILRKCWVVDYTKESILNIANTSKSFKKSEQAGEWSSASDLWPCRFSGKKKSPMSKQTAEPVFSVQPCDFLRATGNKQEPSCLDPVRKEALRDMGSWKSLQLSGTTSVRQWIGGELSCVRMRARWKMHIYGKWLNISVAQARKMVNRTNIRKIKYRKEMRLMYWKLAADDVICSGHSVLSAPVSSPWYLGT